MYRIRPFVNNSFLYLVRRSFSSNVDSQEVGRFSSLADDWWNEQGSLKALHSMNAVRIPWISDSLSSTRSSKALTGFKIVDVGCGAGILSEPLARLGANVCGIDASADCIAVAEERAAKNKDLTACLSYQNTSIEELTQSDFDALVASEIIEHVQDPQSFVSGCVSRVKQGGSLFFTTINRTYLSQLLAIFLAENVLRVVPVGIHDWSKFVPPSDLEIMLEREGCNVRLINGLYYNPVCNSWGWMTNTSVNYALHAVKI